MIILLDGKEYAIGLNWFAISSEEEIESFEQQMDLHYGISKVGKKTGEHSAVALAGPEYVDQVSLASMLSFAYKNLLFVCHTDVKSETGQDCYYLCAIKNGVVTVEGDAIGDSETIVALYQEKLAELTVDMPLTEIERLSAGVLEELYPDLNPIELHAILEPAQRYASQATIGPLKKGQLSNGAIAAIVAVVLIVLYFVFSWIFQKPPPPPPPVQKPVVHHVAPPPPVVIKRDPFQSFMDTFTVRLDQTPRSMVISSVVNAIKTMPLKYNGWDVSEIKFEGTHIDNITVALTRSEYATVADLDALKSSKQTQKLDIDPNMNTALATLTFDSDITFIDQGAIRILVGGTSNNFYKLIAELQQHHYQFNDTTDKTITFFRANSVKISGEGLWALLQLQDLLLPFQTFGVKEIAVKMNNGTMTWTLEGMIYG